MEQKISDVALAFNPHMFITKIVRGANGITVGNDWGGWLMKPLVNDHQKSFSFGEQIPH